MKGYVQKVINLKWREIHSTTEKNWSDVKVCVIFLKDSWRSTSRKSSMASHICRRLTQCWERPLSATCWCRCVPASTSCIHSLSASLLTFVLYAGCTDSLVHSCCCLQLWPCWVESIRTGSRRESLVRSGTRVLHVHLSSTASLPCRCWAPRTNASRIMRISQHSGTFILQNMYKYSLCSSSSFANSNGNNKVHLCY